MPTFHIEKTETQCRVTWWFLCGGAIFMRVWLALWTVACVAQTWESFIKSDIAMFFFLLPFWVVWCVVLILTARMPFGKTKFVLSKDGLEVRWTRFLIKRKKQYDITDICQFNKKKHRAFWSHAGFPLYGEIYYSLQIVCRGGNTRFIVQSNEEELKKLCKQLNAFLRKLKKNRI